MTSSCFHPQLQYLDMAMEKADDPRVQWRVVVAAMPRTSVGCSKNLTSFVDGKENYNTNLKQEDKKKIFRSFNE